MAEDDLRDRAPGVGERGPELVVAWRRIRLPHQHRLVEPAAQQVAAELAYPREVETEQLLARDRPPERALAVGDKAVHRDAHRVDEHGLHGNGTARGHMVGDLFHAGHVALLREARRHGDWLIVGVLSDETAASPTLSMGIASSCMTAPPCSGCPPRGLYGRRTPLPTLDPSFAVGREDRGEVSRFCRASLRAGVGRLLARSGRMDMGFRECVLAETGLPISGRIANLTTQRPLWTAPTPSLPRAPRRRRVTSSSPAPAPA